MKQVSFLFIKILLAVLLCFSGLVFSSCDLLGLGSDPASENTDTDGDGIPDVGGFGY